MAFKNEAEMDENSARAVDWDEVVNGMTQEQLRQYINNPITGGRIYMNKFRAMAIMRHLYNKAYMIKGNESMSMDTASTAPTSGTCEGKNSDGTTYYISDLEHLLVDVTFDNSKYVHSVQTRYKCRSWFRPRVGEKIIIDSPNDGYVICTVRAVSTHWELNNYNIGYRWVVGPIDDTLYLKRKATFIAEQKRKMLTDKVEEAKKLLESYNKQLDEL